MVRIGIWFLHLGKQSDEHLMHSVVEFPVWIAIMVRDFRSEIAHHAYVMHNGLLSYFRLPAGCSG